jgi:hypothetical protein
MLQRRVLRGHVLLAHVLQSGRRLLRGIMPPAGALLLQFHDGAEVRGRGQLLRGPLLPVRSVVLRGRVL